MKGKAKNKTEYLIRPFEVKEVKEVNENGEEFYIITGYASVYGNVDLGDDIVEAAAFAQDLLDKGNDRPILWQHYSCEPIGVGTFFEDGKGLRVTIKLPKSDTFVKGRVMPQVKVGSVTGLSIGYKIVEFTKDPNGTYRLVILKLIETSLVTFPMNEQARLDSAKELIKKYEVEKRNSIQEFKDLPLADIKTEWDKLKAINRIKENTNSTEKPSKHYKNFFFCYDENKVDDFESYRIPYVDYIDNQFKAVPRALSEIVGIFAGVKNTLKISQEIQKSIKLQINKYYLKMGREDPFIGENLDITFFDSYDMEFMDQKDKMKMFDVNVILSNSAKSLIAGLLCSPDSSGGEVNKKSGCDLMRELKELNKSFGG